MRCLHCGRRLSLLRKLADNGFCSEEHRLAFQQQQSDIALARLMESQRRIDRPSTPAAKSQAPPKPKAMERAEPAQERVVPMAGFRPSPPPVRVEGRRVQWDHGEPQFETILRCLPREEMDLPRPGFSFRSAVHSMEPAAPPPPSLVSAAPALRSEAQLPQMRLQLGENPLPLGAGLPMPLVFSPRSDEVRLIGGSGPMLALSGAPEAPRAGLRPLAPVIAAQVERDPEMAALLGVAPHGPLSTLQGRRIRYSRTRWIKLGPLFESEFPARRFRVTERAPGMAARTSVAEAAPFRATSVPRSPAPPAGAFRTYRALPRLATECSPRLLAHPENLLAVEMPSAAVSGRKAGAVCELLKANSDAAEPKLGESTLATSWKRVEELEPVEVRRAHAAIKILTADAQPVRCAAAPLAPGGDLRPVAGLGRAESLQPLAMPAWVKSASAAHAQVAGSVQGQAISRPALPCSGLEPVDTSAPAADAPFVERLFPLHPGRASCLAPAAHICSAEPFSGGGFRSFIPQARLQTDRPDGSGPKPAFLRETLGERFRNWWPPTVPGTGFLRAAPADLKWIGLGLPLVLGLILYSTLPKVSSKPAAPVAHTVETPAGVPAEPASRWERFQQSISERAAINLVDDFRGGLGAWQGEGRWAETWKYNQAQFVEPGTLALYSPTLPMTDYSFEFLGQISKKSLNWVFRAKDSKNYYAMRLVLTKAGPLPQAAIYRYSVVDGKESAVKNLPLPMSIKGDTLYRIRMDVKGETFTTYVQGQVVDSFSDSRMTRGGIGFFSPRGDQSYLRWVEVSYQYDFLGRFCALLAPYSVQAEGRSAD